MPSRGLRLHRPLVFDYADSRTRCKKHPTKENECQLMNLVAIGQQKSWNAYQVSGSLYSNFRTQSEGAETHPNLCGRVRGNWLSNKAASAGRPNGIV